MEQDSVKLSAESEFARAQAALVVEDTQAARAFIVGRVHLIKGDKNEALRIWRDGMAKGGFPELLQQLERLGMRSQSVIPALHRNNPLNRYLGILFSRLGLR